MTIKVRAEGKYKERERETFMSLFELVRKPRVMPGATFLTDERNIFKYLAQGRAKRSVGRDGLRLGFELGLRLG